VTGITHSTALWYASRATGAVSLVLLSTVVILGMLVSRQGSLPGLPRFAVTGLHRNLSLLSVAFLVIHVVSAIADPYVTIGWAAAVIPFASAYKPFWLGLGALSLDLIGALILTSLVRARMNRRTWRGVHWLAYAAWPLAVAHSLGSGSDMRSGPMLGLLIGCLLAVAAAGLWRLSRAARDVPRAGRAAAALAQVSPPPAPPGQPDVAHAPGSRVPVQQAGRP
jgi:methionine sulfoxide reductase heme-binding subunit